MTPHEWASLVEALEDDLARRDRGQKPSMDAERAWQVLRREIEFVARVCAPRDDADDVAQSVLVKLQSSEAVRRLRAARAPAGYLVVIVRNAARDLRRRRPLAAEFGSDVPDAVESDPIDLLDQADRRETLQRALEALSEMDRTILRLRFWDEMPIGEIAGALNLPYSTVAVRLFRAQRRLKAELEARDRWR